MCSSALARSMSANAAEKPTDVANSPAMLSLQVACWQVRAVCPNQWGLEKSRSQLDVTALRVHRRWTHSTLVKSPMGLHPPVALGDNTMMIVANTAGQYYAAENKFERFRGVLE